MHLGIMKSLFVLAMVLAISQALDVSESANSLGTAASFDNAIGSSRFDMVARAPKGGKGGHSGGDGSSGSGSGSSSGSGSGSSSGSGSCSTSSSSTTNCLSSEKVCGDACIPSSATCCTYGSSLYSYYCLSTERCVSTSSSSLYKCCPSTSSSCTSTSPSANYATAGTLRRATKTCASDAARAGVSAFAIFLMSSVLTAGLVLGRI
ncbi:hypothetical protein MAA_11808 [Metarhizium robertsii ARSEF 23]|nr:uncharacterized protein MAA_11808 [Metarhizium robertsii ARSEF 23]KHO10591.1 hypothetical protein MAA_11808 [Metarhizium robertsii ARSEF 23]